MFALAARRRRFLLIIIAFSAAAVCTAPLVGVVNIFSFDTERAADLHSIFWSLRMPRILLAFACGMALGVGGLIFQTMLRNPLATPYTLGVASGASCGAVILILAAPGWAYGGINSSVVGGWSGAMLATGLVYALGSVAGVFSIGTLLLAGVAMSFFFSSLILFFQYLGDPAQIYRIVRWLMGGLETVGYRDAALSWTMAILLLVVALKYLRELDAMGIDDELAGSWGVPVAVVQRRLFFAVSLSIGGIVSITGPIGFIGIMLPHVCRQLVGPRMTLLLPATATASGAFLVFCDAAARTIASPAEIPVGIITALLGGPFFIWILLSRRSG
ncbi:MAG: iron ABC transporter permease [Bdellovibrionales bacterium]|nr:iron ABC transporter permease [Bdellovibrionales bacterium]